MIQKCIEIFLFVFSILDRLGKLRTAGSSYSFNPCEKPSRAGFICSCRLMARSSEESSAISRSKTNILLHHATPTADTDLLLQPHPAVMHQQTCGACAQSNHIV